MSYSRSKAVIERLAEALPWVLVGVSMVLVCGWIYVFLNLPLLIPRSLGIFYGFMAESIVEALLTLFAYIGSFAGLYLMYISVRSAYNPKRASLYLVSGVLISVLSYALLALLFAAKRPPAV